ncbi:CLN3 protein-domain-containing protein [Aspergillus transmontanensis]|uniref:CLN3 protein-domain-containing protein n=1 Tax=Aspergillus transmontanensis TaxID=1034304 RepID=A0A5N6WFX1_9EURO|nr:CLN3 protein-domain-containing protein [Aspergillus transmontanensis]
MPRIPASEETPMLPLPGAPASSWARFRERLSALFSGADPRVCIAFWLFGLINNVLYVIILSAALDLVGPGVPKGVVLLADVIPSFGTKLIAPYFIHVVPYSVRVVIFVLLSAIGMLLVALSPDYTAGGTISTKIAGIILASVSSGGGELSFLGLTHFYGPFSLAAWGSGTGAAGLVGAGAYALATTSFGLSVKTTLLASACLPAVMVVSFFTILPRSPMHHPLSAVQAGYRAVGTRDRLAEERVFGDERDEANSEVDALLASIHSVENPKATQTARGSIRWQHIKANVQRARGLFFPFMLPLLLVYVAEYTINQGVAPTLLFPLTETPFAHFRAFYPAYNAIYQVGVFISRSSTPFFRIHDLYFPSCLQVVNLAILTLHSLFNFIPSVYIVFVIIFWEGLLGGLVYVNTFAEIGERVPQEDREFSLGATTVSDSGGICIAGFVSMIFEVWLCDWQDAHGRDFCHHVLGRPSTKFRKIQVLAVFLFWTTYLLRGNKHGPPVVRNVSSRLSAKLSVWQTTVGVFLWLYLCRNFAKIVGLECPEPLANLYSRSFFRATWITTALDAGFWTAMKVKPKWLRDIASLAFTVYYLFAAEQADEKVRRVRATLTVEHLRVSWNKGTTPYLWALASLVRPRLTKYPPRAIRIPRPPQSSYTEPTNAWLYFDGPLSALRDQTCIILDIPGGGYVAMSPRASEDRLLAWAGKTKVPILSLDYKKAPEYPYPYALNECYDVYHTIITTRGRCLGLSGNVRPRVVLSGDSAGGNLAVGTTLMALQSGSSDAPRWQGDHMLPRPDGLVLAYPALNMRVESWMTEEQMSLIQDKSARRTNENVLRQKNMDYQRLTPFTSPGPSTEDLLRDSSSDLDLEADDVAQGASKKLEEKLKADNLATQAAAVAQSHHPKQIRTRLAVSSMISYVHDRILTPEMMRAMIILYIGPHNRPDFSTDFLLSPVLAPEALLARFPKTYIVTGERDPLVDDTVIFAGRLRQAKLHQFRERQELGLEKSHRTFNEKDHVEVSLLPGISHGFLQMAGFFPDSWKHINKCATWIQDLFEAAERRKSSSSLLQSLHDSTQYYQVLKAGASSGSPRNHKRSLTGESSGDEDRPLEMSLGRMTPLNPDNSTDNSSSQMHGKSSNETSHVHLQGSTPNASDIQSTSGSQGKNASRGRRSQPKGLSRRRRDAPTKLTMPPAHDYISDAMQTPPPKRRDRSIGSLPSEEDLLDRRMNGLAGGLMGIGEGARTP